VQLLATAPTASQLDFADTAAFGRDVSSDLVTSTTTPAATGEWTGNKTQYTFASGSVDHTGTTEEAIYFNTVLSGDFDIQFTYTDFGATGSVGFFASSEVGTFNAAQAVSGMNSMTNSFYIRDDGAANEVVYYGGATQATPTFADGSVIKFTRRGGVVKIYDDGSLTHTFTQRYAGDVYFTIATNTFTDFDSLSFSEYSGNSYGDFNFTAADQLSDTPTDSAADGIGNYATFDPNNPIPYSSTATLSNGNREFVSSGGGRLVNIAIPLTGKWKAEFLCTSTGGGIKQGQAGVTSALTSATYSTVGSRYYTSGTGSSGTIAVDGSVQASSLTDWGPGDIITVLVDMDSGTYGTIDYKINDVSIGAGPYNLGAPAGPLHFVGYDGSANQRITLNSGVNGFTYTDTGYKALATQNLPAPTIADPSAHFNTLLYTGNGTSQSITGVGFQPDLVWMKSRDFSYSHTFVDVVRGATKEIYSNANER
jgi:hypothetical protein